VDSGGATVGLDNPAGGWSHSTNSAGGHSHTDYGMGDHIHTPTTSDNLPPYCNVLFLMHMMSYKTLSEGLKVGEKLTKKPIKVLMAGLKAGETLKSVLQPTFWEGIRVGEKKTKIIYKVLLQGLKIGEWREAIKLLAVKIFTESMKIGAIGKTFPTFIQHFSEGIGISALVSLKTGIWGISGKAISFASYSIKRVAKSLEEWVSGRQGSLWEFFSPRNREISITIEEGDLDEIERFLVDRSDVVVFDQWGSYFAKIVTVRKVLDGSGNQVLEIELQEEKPV